MILVDANLLVYAHVKESPDHLKARDWLDDKLSRRARVGLPWPSLLGFVRLVSNPRIYRNPEPVAKAWSQVEEWLDAPPSWIPQPSEQHRELLREIMPFASSSNLIPDAHMAALALEHGLELNSTDGDFARFPGLRFKNPLLTRA